MSSIAFSIFENDKNCVWMKIYVWSKDKNDLVEELKILNSLLVKHGAEGYDVFKVSINNLLLPVKKNEH